jgi:hypothetical protein
VRPGRVPWWWKRPAVIFWSRHVRRWLLGWTSLHRNRIHTPFPRSWPPSPLPCPPLFQPREGYGDERSSRRRAVEGTGHGSEHNTDAKLDQRAEERDAGTAVNENKRRSISSAWPPTNPTMLWGGNGDMLPLLVRLPAAHDDASDPGPQFWVSQEPGSPEALARCVGSFAGLDGRPSPSAFSGQVLERRGRSFLGVVAERTSFHPLS